MKTISEFEFEEYEKMLSSLDLSDEDENEDKAKYFDAQNFGEIPGEYIATNELKIIYTNEI